MKKLLIIAVAFCLFIIGCSKVDLNPVPLDAQVMQSKQVATFDRGVSNTPDASNTPDQNDDDGITYDEDGYIHDDCDAPDVGILSVAGFTGNPCINHCYVITNTESDNGLAEYLLFYWDCNGIYQKMILPLGKSVTLCLKYGTVQTNFAYSIKHIGKC